MDKSKIIADMEEYRDELAEELERVNAALASLEGGQRRLPTKKRGSGGKPFSPKYDKPAHVLALAEFRDAAPAGLALSELQKRLRAKDRDFTDQAMRLVVNGLQKEGKLRKAYVQGQPFKFRYHYIGPKKTP